MPKYWLISDRDRGGNGSHRNNDGLTYWVSDAGPLTDISNWKKETPSKFQTVLVEVSDQFPLLGPAETENQSHIAILIPESSNGFNSATSFYESLCGRLFEGPNSLGLCILFDWPSLAAGESDRRNARMCAEDLADILVMLLDWLVSKRDDATRDPAAACRAKVSLIAHGIGNYVLQKAMSIAWARRYQLRLSLVNQLVMVAADVDNDLFDAGALDNNDGTAMVALSHRITVLYSGRDAVLGASEELKRSGKRCLGRSGLAHRPPLASQLTQTDNVWDVDCSSFFPSSLREQEIHVAYFKTDAVLSFIRQILRGLDQGGLQVAVSSASQPDAATRMRDSDHKQQSVKPEIVLLVHGIRTHATWEEMVRSQLQDKPKRIVVPLRYGFMDVFQFWFPLWTRNRAIEKIYRRILDARSTYPGASYSIIAHSFGTYAICRILDDYPDIVLHRLVLCGSIVPNDFRWDHLAGRLESEVVNECGSRDIWPVLAKSTTWGYGDSGAFGFGTPRVQDRFHNYKHSDYFNQEFVEEYWLPYFLSGDIVDSEYEINRKAIPWWVSVLGVPWKYVVVAVILFGLVAAVLYSRA